MLEQSFVGLFHVCILVFYLVAIVMPVVGVQCVCVMVYWKQDMVMLVVHKHFVHVMHEFEVVVVHVRASHCRQQQVAAH